MQASTLFDRFTSLNIVIIGDVMIDRYLSGKVDRISPEAPVPVIELQSEDNRLGGAANVALNIQALGATPYLFSVVGEDANGKLLQDLLSQQQCSPRYIQTSSERQTTVKTRVIAQSQQLLRVDREDKHPLSDAELKDIIEALRDLFENKDIDLILFQDYNKGVLTPKLIREVILEALRRDIPTAVDPKFANFWEFKRVTLFKPNLREIQQQLGYDITPTLADLQKVTKEINRRLGNTHTMITLSDKGLFFQAPGYSEIVPTFPRSIADVCGAGDTVISVAALALAAALEPPKVARIANLAGGQVCEKVGVVPVDAQQLRAEFAQIV